MSTWTEVTRRLPAARLVCELRRVLLRALRTDQWQKWLSKPPMRIQMAASANSGIAFCSSDSNLEANITETPGRVFVGCERFTLPNRVTSELPVDRNSVT